MIKRLSITLFVLTTWYGFGQDKVTEAFAGTRVINNHSNETLPKNTLEFIIGHKFGDIAGATGGVDNFFGFDNIADVRFAFEYGIIDNLDIGIGRSKGVGARTQMLDGYAKYSILQQKTSGMPISLTFVSSFAFSYVKQSHDSTALASYPTFWNRMIFTNQLLVTRKFGNRFTWQVNFGYNHRNYVKYDQINGVYFVGTSGRLRFTKNIALLAEYNYTFNRLPTENHQDPLSFGIEITTGGHIFALHFSNAKSLNENLFIPETTSNWGKGQWRFGFTFNRRFKL
ncbi:MAG: DUF5777 family beta-barrel protein [Crocinitomicaceae bacterium]|nr:hypothetical protein [Crocinitomicaceae bacterium]